MPDPGGFSDPAQEQSTEITITEAIQRLKANGFHTILSSLRTKANSQKKSKNEPITPSSTRRPQYGGQAMNYYTLSDMARLVELAGEVAYRNESNLTQEQKDTKIQAATSLFN